MLRLLFALALTLAVAGRAAAGPDEDAIRRQLHSAFDKPEARLVVEPIVVAGEHAIAGWSQGDVGGRALLRRGNGGNWSLVLCSGDGIKSAESLQQAGVPSGEAATLARRLTDAERTLDPQRLALFATFQGTVMMDASGQHAPEQHAPKQMPRTWTFRAGNMVVETPWLQATEPGAQAAGGYMKITNMGKVPDRLVGGTLDGARGFALRETIVADNATSMRALANGIAIEPGHTVELKPGGYQVTASDLRRGYAQGETVKGTLIFEKAGTLGIEYAVPLEPPTAHAPKVGSLGASFELTDHRGQRFSSTLLAGRPYAILFGFTYCPDVCPTTLLVMSNSLRALGEDADKLRVVFVTVDPKRDTPEVLGEYLSSFDPRIIGLTGSGEQIAATAKGWNAFYDVLPERDGTYSIVHSAHVYLMDRRNRLVGTMSFQEPDAEQLAKLKSLIAVGAE